MRRQITSTQRRELRAVARLQFEAQSLHRAAAAAAGTQREYIRRLKAERTRLLQLTADRLRGRQPAVVLAELERMPEESFNPSSENGLRHREIRNSLRELATVEEQLQASEPEIQHLEQRVADAMLVSNPLSRVVEAVLDYLGATREELGLGFSTFGSSQQPVGADGGL